MKKSRFHLTSQNKVHFTSLGCPRNLVDTEVMLGLVLKAGYEVTPSPEEADFLVVNTCGFLEAARQEALSTMQALETQKKEGAKLVVTGCMVQKHSGDIKAAFPDVHYLLGSGEVENILKALEPAAGEVISSAQSYLEAGEVPRTLSTPRHYAYLKIAEGCRKKCAFCIIPDIKGPLRSKPIDRIVKEFLALLEQGVFEIILIAQDLGDFGKDFGMRDGLLEVLKALLAIQRPFWLRLMYLYPDEITDELIEIIQSDPRVCHYVDMPIQHIDDTLLKAMRRKTTGEDIRSTLTVLREKIPDMVIRTSLMVGFPGETQEQFKQLVDFVQEATLDHVGVFEFSPEPGSTAATLPEQIPEEVKKERREILMQAQQAALAKRQNLWVGKTLPVIVEGYHPDSPLLMRGRTAGQCPEIDGIVIINDGRKVQAFGKVYWVEITQTAGYDLIGKVVKAYHLPSKDTATKLTKRHRLALA